MRRPRGDVDVLAAELGRMSVDLAVAQAEAERWRAVAVALDAEVKVLRGPEHAARERQAERRRTHAFLSPTND